ncbi:hypothetical protein [Marinobacterium aestuariivivens]|uniref:MmgE/PrpD C-terminal domain-containing protein n=1 Tax=Marinobacterium aestuariivivens TaxID=1698799 RepID=A0ABW1ZXT5_9GAMM
MIEGELGLLAATSSRARAEALGQTGAGDWKIEEVSEKPWPGCRHTHPVVEAALRYRPAVSTDEVDRVEMQTYRSAVEFCDDAVPDSPHRARFSLQHAFAVALSKGEPELQDYEGEALNDAVIGRLRRKIAVFEAPDISAEFPQRFGCRVRLYTRTGDCIEQSVLSARGDPENPVDAAASRRKFRQLLAHAGVADELAADFEQAILGLPSSGSVPLSLFAGLEALVDL